MYDLLDNPPVSDTVDGGGNADPSRGDYVAVVGEGAGSEAVAGSGDEAGGCSVLVAINHGAPRYSSKAGNLSEK